MKPIHYIFCLFGILTGLLLSCEEENTDPTPWVSLFNEENLEGWSLLAGTAHYAVEEGEIVGYTVHDSPNSFLVTDSLYGDFILELEYKVDSSMNSGIQIRSNSLPHYRDGRVHGYQIEIDPSERAWSAGIYDEARRGWLVPLDNNPSAQQAFQQHQWNHYRIEAHGDSIKTWINNIPAAFLIDDRTAEGFIGLQVHSIGKDQPDSTAIRWRNIRIVTDSISLFTRPMDLAPVNTLNRILHDEAKNGWELLWDGETTKGWRGAKLDSFPEMGWKMKDGILTVMASDGAESAAGGDIVTTANYADFELQLDFKLTPGANSGIKYYVDTELNKGDGSAIGLEYQLLDDALHPDAKLGNHEGSRTLASLYDLIQANPDKYVLPIGSWNHARIVAVNNKVQHWLNGMLVLEYQRKSEEYRKLVSESKYKIWPDFGEVDQGPILIQDHGNEVAFRNVKIRNIKPE